MRKYGLDEGTLYVEGNTLLEPNNFIPSWVSRSFEIKANCKFWTYRKLETRRRKRFHLHSEISEKSMMISIRKPWRWSLTSSSWRKR